MSFDRLIAEEKAKTESAKADMKQHADKLIQGFEKLDESHARRAIWELVQNASDLSENCEIIIDFSNDYFSFSHKGKPFTSNTLTSLIKQVSSKISKDNTDEIGQFGTGFITTHSFGKKFKIDSVLDEYGNYIEIKDFLIDRLAKDSAELVDKLAIQQQEVYKLIKTGDIISIENPETIFSYLSESPTEKNNIIIAEKDLCHYAPIVMTLNRKISIIKVIETGGTVTEYKRTHIDDESNPSKITISINGVDNNIYFLKSEDGSIEIILPLISLEETILIEPSVAKLFLYFPLIGTENWGCNFIINSNRFAPLEARDGIHLNSKNDQTREKEINNRQIIEDASALIFEFIESYANTIKNPVDLAHICFNTNNDKLLLNEYFTELKQNWVDKFKTYELVDTVTGRRIAPIDSLFIDSELLQNEDYFDSIYTLITMFWDNVPSKELVYKWTNIVSEWNEESLNYIGIRDLAQKIQEVGELQFFENPDILQHFYKYLSEQNHEGLFNQYLLIPNIKGEFRQLSGLNISINLPKELINIADVILSDIPKRHIHPDFKFNLELPSYSRKNFTTELNDYLSKQISDKATSRFVTRDFLYKLLDYCKIASSKDSVSIPSNLMKQICKFYEYNEELIEIITIKDDELDLRRPQKGLIRLFLNDIAEQNSEWVCEHLDILKDIISLASGYYDYEEMFLTLPIYPNQLNELCVQSTLKVDDNIPTEIKVLFDQIVRPNKSIKSSLVLSEFSEYLKNKDNLSPRSLTEKIESVFSDDGQYANINSHPFKNDILFIIEKIANETEWGQYFPILNSKRANVMLDRVSDNQIKNDVFSILTLDLGKINKLGSLARNPNFDLIIALGEKAFEEAKRTRTDFQFKYEIGKRIEKLINEKLGKDLERYAVEVRDVQNGQDIVISSESEAVYYIEVKSRWNSESSILMSKNQFTNAALNKDKYSLCCVEMSDYKNGQPERYEVDDVNIIFDRIKIVNTIGKEIEPLIKGMLQTTDAENEITLYGDYKATIPQRLIKTGSNIDEFVNYLISKLNLI